MDPQACERCPLAEQLAARLAALEAAAATTQQQLVELVARVDALLEAARDEVTTGMTYTVQANSTMRQWIGEMRALRLAIEQRLPATYQAGERAA